MLNIKWLSLSLTAMGFNGTTFRTITSRYPPHKNSGKHFAPLFRQMVTEPAEVPPRCTQAFSSVSLN
jgi:hypothetical protein